MILVFVLWLMFAGAVGFLADDRGRSAIAWVVLSLLLSPVIGFIALMAAGDAD